MASSNPMSLFGGAVDAVQAVDTTRQTLDSLMSRYTELDKAKSELDDEIKSVKEEIFTILQDNGLKSDKSIYGTCTIKESSTRESVALAKLKKNNPSLYGQLQSAGAITVSNVSASLAIKLVEPETTPDGTGL